MLGKRAIDPWALDLKACRRAVTRKLRTLPAPRDMIPAERMAARAVLAGCKACMRCERAL